MKTSQEILRLRAALLAWYDSEGRTLPWRIRPEDRARGVRPDPYAIWLSEIMCQQTVIKAATPYWHKFLRSWPNVMTLAAAPRDEVLAAWAGLGYYARARNLHKCAQMIAADYNGEFPKTEPALLALPGIGAYTAAAIAAICYGQSTNVVDGNVERVITRLRAVKELIPKAKTEIRMLASAIADPHRPGDYAQGLMDLGAHICRPRAPKCHNCPWLFSCKAFKEGDPETYPRKALKKPRPVRHGAVFYVDNKHGFWARTRPDKGLLGGMAELPGTVWTTEEPSEDIWLAQAPLAKNWYKISPPIKHVFTHFTLHLTVYTARHNGAFPDMTATLERLEDHAFPSLMRKAISKAIDPPVKTKDI